MTDYGNLQQRLEDLALAVVIQAAKDLHQSCDERDRASAKMWIDTEFVSIWRATGRTKAQEVKQQILAGNLPLLRHSYHVRTAV